LAKDVIGNKVDGHPSSPKTPPPTTMGFVFDLSLLSNHGNNDASIFTFPSVGPAVLSGPFVYIDKNNNKKKEYYINLLSLQCFFGWAIPRIENKFYYQ